MAPGTQSGYCIGDDYMAIKMESRNGCLCYSLHRQAQSRFWDRTHSDPPTFCNTNFLHACCACVRSLKRKLVLGYHGQQSLSSALHLYADFHIYIYIYTATLQANDSPFTNLLWISIYREISSTTSAETA